MCTKSDLTKYERLAILETIRYLVFKQDIFEEDKAEYIRWLLQQNFGDWCPQSKDEAEYIQQRGLLIQL